MQPYNYQQTPNIPGNAGQGFDINIIFKIAGPLAVVCLLFLPLGGLADNPQYAQWGALAAFTIKGYDLVKGLFQSGAQWNIWSVLFLLSLVSGVVIIFLNKPIQFIICAGAGIISYAIFGIKLLSETGMGVISPRIGTYLGMILYVGIVIGSIVKLLGAKKNPVLVTSYGVPPIYNPQQQSPIQQPMQQPYQAPPPPPPQMQPQYQASSPQPQMQQTARKQKFCGKCGNKFAENYTGKFCDKCGAPKLY